MKKLFNISTWSVSFVAQLILFALAFILIFAVSYILGWRYLEGRTLAGNDSFSYFSVVYWISKYFPNIPFWFPQQGGGVSFAGYPWFAAYLVCILTKVTSLDLVQAYRILGFLSVPLTGLGVFMFAWARLTDVKPVWMRQVIGIIAGLFYIISPLAWIWLVKWGFYSEHVSHIFVPFAALFFDIYINRLFGKRFDFIFRLSLLGTLTLWLLAFITHFFAGVSLIFIFLILGLTRFLFQKEEDAYFSKETEPGKLKKQFKLSLWIMSKLRLAKSVFLPILIFGILFACLFLYRYYPYSSYNNAVADGGFTGYSAVPDRQGVFNNTLTPKMMLSLEMPKSMTLDARAGILDLRMPFFIWILIIPSLLFGFFKSKKVFVFSLVSVAGFILNTSVDLRMFLSTVPLVSSFLNLFMFGRVFYIYERLITPISAAFGAYVFWELLGALILSFLKNRIKFLYYIFYPIKITAVLIMMLATIYYLVFQYYSLPSKSRSYVNFGAFSGKIDLRDIWENHPVLSATTEDLKNEYLEKHPEYNTQNSIANFPSIETICSRNNNVDFYPQDSICRYFYKKAKTDPIFPPMEDVLRAKEKCNENKNNLNNPIYAYCAYFYNDSLLDQLYPNNWIEKWKKVGISSDVSGEVAGSINLFSDLPKDKEYRFDISGFSGRQIMIAPLINSNSQIQVYINTLSLIYNAWNYQAQVMYTEFPLYQKPGVISELGRWFGLNYVLLVGSKLEPFSYWSQDPNWLGPKEGNGWRKFNEPISIATWDSRPKVLVISDNKKFFYDQTFRFFTWGGLLYNQAIPIRGEKEVDSYSLEDLKKYDIIYMRAYGYKSKGSAYNLLDQYIRDGGKLIFDTGWQYYVPDFKIDNAPYFMPFDSLKWQNLDKNSKFIIENKSALKEIDTNKLGSLVWEDSPWGVSAPNNLREWGKTFLSYDGKPLIVGGDYGKGRVVWIGYNLVPFTEGKNLSEHIKVFNNLMTYLNNGFNIPKEYKVDKKRIDPDNVEFSLNETVDYPSSLYFRESFYPDWEAKLVGSNGQNKANIKIDRAGPGFMLMHLPKVSLGDRVLLGIKKPLLQSFFEILSPLTLVLLFIYLFIPKITKLFRFLPGKNIRGMIFGIFDRHVKTRAKNISSELKKSKVEDEEDY